MSTVRDRGVIDLTMVEDSRYVLVIADDLPWTFANRQQHARMLQDKLNDYLGYVVSGQAEEAHPGLRPVIRIISQHPYSDFCLGFLERVRSFVKSRDDLCDIEWAHPAGSDCPDDGFSDDLAFDMAKIYPRLKKNWAENPLEEVSLLPASDDAPDYSDQMVMVRVMDSFIGMFVQDAGEVFTYLTYDMLPEGISVEELQSRAFDNLIRDVRFRMCASREPGIYGILAGGNFEAESLCLSDVWEAAAKELEDDVIISVPTKDIVYFTKASDERLRTRMLEMAREMLETNVRESPLLVFCRDVFVYLRAEGQLTVCDELRL